VIAFVVDGKAGVQPLDQKIAGLLRKTDVPVVLMVEQDGQPPERPLHLDFWELGLGEPQPVSALSGKGSGDVLDVVGRALPEMEEPPEEALSVAVVGKPNVGKSSFINRLLGEDRLVVSEVAGTTRDSIDTLMRYHGRSLIFVDTAGLRRQARIHESLEYYSALRTEQAVERADVCLLLVDGTEPVHVQDLKIAEKAWSADAACHRGEQVGPGREGDGTAPAFEKQLRERRRRCAGCPSSSPPRSRASGCRRRWTWSSRWRGAGAARPDGRGERGACGRWRSASRPRIFEGSPFGCSTPRRVVSIRRRS
jgi:GTPase